MDDPLIWVRVIHFAATMMVTGGVFFHAFVAEPAFQTVDDTRVAARVRFRLALIGWIVLAVTVLSGGAWLVLQTEQMSELSLGQVLQQDALWTVLSETDFGYAWMVRLVMAGLLAAMLSWRGPAPWRESLRLSAAVAASAGLVGTLAWAGHGAAGSDIEGAVHLAADILHLIAAAAWGGALIPLALLLHTARRDPVESSAVIARKAVLRFSPLGILSVGTLVATGAVNTWVLAGSVQALIGTDYGRLLLVKVALFLVMLSFGAVNRLWLTPHLAPVASASATAAALRQIERNSMIEAGLAAIIIAIVALLGTLPPGLEDQAIN
ncbi:MAG TPA: copper homeostasis membrane protein CopD [Xanthobacteraceae bacterium]